MGKGFCGRGCETNRSSKGHRCENRCDEGKYKYIDTLSLCLFGVPLGYLRASKCCLRGLPRCVFALLCCIVARLRSHSGLLCCSPACLCCLCALFRCRLARLRGSCSILRRCSTRFCCFCALFCCCPAGLCCVFTCLGCFSHFIKMLTDNSPVLLCFLLR